jgi:predicted Zn-dependent protease
VASWGGAKLIKTQGFKLCRRNGSRAGRGEEDGSQSTSRGHELRGSRIESCQQGRQGQNRRPLNQADKRHLKQHVQAAEGWLELGTWTEANAELDEITPAMRAHPDVLAMRFRIYEAAGKWDEAIEIASALCKLRPKEGLPCLYLGRALKRAIEVSDSGELKLRALYDARLGPVWKDLC